MSEIDITKRLEFLAEKFNIFEIDNGGELLNKLTSDNYLCSTITVDDGKKIVAIVGVKVNPRGRELKKTYISDKIFSDMVMSDPTNNKMFLQWMLNVFSRLLKDDEIVEAERFALEDLPQAKTYLELFEGNKRKKLFKELCASNERMKPENDGLSDEEWDNKKKRYNWGDINQYNDLGSLFDAVYPFMEKNTSDLEKSMQSFVDAGQAEIPVKDRQFTVFVPKTKAANCVFKLPIAAWCTAQPDQGMFDSYIKQKRPNGENSKIYIIVNNKVFEGESEEMYQIHFESRQIKDKSNSFNDDCSLYEPVISKSEAVGNYFRSELGSLAKEWNGSLDNNTYVDYLVQFGFAESYFDYIDVNIPHIQWFNKDLPKMPDLSRFKSLDYLTIVNANMLELHPSIGKLSTLNMLAIGNNKISGLPKEIGELKNLEFINIVSNPIMDIPDEISKLDISRGGNLKCISLNSREMGMDAYNKLKHLLPNTHLNDTEG